jgi:hypothetical protein
MALTHDESQALARGELVHLTLDGIPCVAIREDLYVERPFDGHDRDAPTPLTLARMIRDITAEEDAEDPALESYQQYKKR